MGRWYLLFVFFPSSRHSPRGARGATDGTRGGMPGRLESSGLPGRRVFQSTDDLDVIRVVCIRFGCPFTSYLISNVSECYTIVPRRITPTFPSRVHVAVRAINHSCRNFHIAIDQNTAANDKIDHFLARDRHYHRTNLFSPYIWMRLK